MSAIFQIDPNSGLATAQFNKFAKFSMIYFILSLSSTTISTLLIVYRIISVSRETGFSTINPYRKVLEIIVESAALYCIILIIYLPFLVRDDFSSGYPQALLISITVSRISCLTLSNGLTCGRGLHLRSSLPVCHLELQGITQRFTATTIADLLLRL